MFHIVIIFLLLFEPRYSWPKTLAASFAGAGLLLCFNVFAMLWKGHGIIMRLAFFSCTLPSLALFYILSKYRDGRFFFLFCLSDTTCFWILQVTNFLDRLLGDTYFIMMLSRLALFPVVEFLFWRYLRTPFLTLQREMRKGWWVFAAVGATYYLLIMLTSVPVGYDLPDAQGIARIILVLLLMPLTYLTILHSLWRQKQAYCHDQQLALQRREYEAIRQKIEFGRIFRHDMRHHMVILDGLLQQGDNDGAQQYIHELGVRLNSLTPRDWCANPAVNAVLSSYIDLAEQDECSITADVRLPEKLLYDEMDLCIILANALENAINACHGRPKEESGIDLKIRLTDNRNLTLSLANSCPQPVLFGENGLPAINQKPEEGHGFGLRSIKSIVDRYGGLMRCQWEAGQFSLRIALFPKQNVCSPPPRKNRSSFWTSIIDRTHSFFAK